MNPRSVFWFRHRTRLYTDGHADSNESMVEQANLGSAKEAKDFSVYRLDRGAVVEHRNASLFKGGCPAKRMRIFGHTKFEFVLSKKAFRPFQVMEEARVSGAILTSFSASGAFVQRPSHSSPGPRSMSPSRCPLPL